MDRLLRPNVLTLDPDTPTASSHWNHWIHRFRNFIRSTQATEEEKLRLLINYISPEVFEYVSLCQSYNEAISILESTFVKPVNEVFARHKLLSRRQQPNESIDRYVEALRQLSRDCQFKAVTAEKNRDDCIRDSFIRGLQSTHIRQRLLENTLTLSLSDAHSQARALESAQAQSQQYEDPCPSTTINALSRASSEKGDSDNESKKSDRNLCALRSRRCYFCGQGNHSRNDCPARDAKCKNCSKVGHYAKVCRSSQSKAITDAQKSSKSTAALATIDACSIGSVSRVKTILRISGRKITGMLDSGSDISLIDEHIARVLGLKIHPVNDEVGLASRTHRVTILGQCKTDLEMLGHCYRQVTLAVLKDLCADLIIGRDVLQQHRSVSFDFGGPRSPLQVCIFHAAKVEPAKLFSSLSSDCKPISVKSRRHTDADSKFIDAEIRKLLEEGIIEKCLSPWRAQVHVVTGFHKKRMVIDYSRTINRYTHLDAYPLPRIDDIVNKVAGYEVFSTIDLRSAYHQVPILEEDRPYTAFEAGGELYQFTRIPFGVTNGVAAFQRVMDGIVRSEGLNDTFAYLDDVTICGKTQMEHDLNLERFFKAAQKYNLTINNEKSSFSLRTISLLGYTICNRTLRPDPERLKPLQNLPPPTDVASLKRVLGIFSHYSGFIRNFSEKITPLLNCKFPLSAQALEAFNEMKKAIMDASLMSIDGDAPFSVETDASDTAIAATLTQAGRPVAFFSRTLTSSERHHSSIEKEAYAIVEAVRYWRHFLLGRHFRLITDQRSVSFMFDTKHSGKVKNEKITRWRLELSCYSYDIVYRPGKENLAADALSRVCVISQGVEDLSGLHQSLCHPGVTRMYHWVRSKNLPYSMDEVRKVTAACKICAELKPRFFRYQGTLIKATRPFERLNVDFKGPLPSQSKNQHILTIVDEYSRFPFAFACKDTSASTVISCFLNLFSIFGAPSYIHSDRGSSFMSKELKDFLTSYGVATSRTTAYNPQGNGQAEKFNGTIWKTIELALKGKGLKITQWELVLQEALHSIRSLLCTSTNATPHERMFSHPRKSGNGQSIPSWLMTPGTVLLKRFHRQSKYEPLVEEVTLVDGNHDYALIRYPDGRETTVSTRHLAPTGENPTQEVDINNEEETEHTEPQAPPQPPTNQPDSTLTPQSKSSPSSKPRTPLPSRLQSPHFSPEHNQPLPSSPQPLVPSNSPEEPPRRSSRMKRPPPYLRDYVQF